MALRITSGVVRSVSKADAGRSGHGIDLDRRDAGQASCYFSTPWADIVETRAADLEVHGVFTSGPLSAAGRGDEGR